MHSQQRMQRPTCTNTRIVTTDDAHRIFHAAGVLHVLGPMVHRRLDAEERRLVQPGAVFVWEERSTTSEAAGLGIERWTDGLRWGPSRVRDFLFYQEKFTRNEGQDVLTKQTYSAWVKLPTGRKKWHLTAYFTQATLNKMKTVNDIPCMRGVAVPPDMYHRARSGKRRRGFRRPTPTEHPSPHSDAHSQPEDPPAYMPFDPSLESPPLVRRFSVSESEESSASSHSQTSPRGDYLAPLSYLQSLNHPRRHPADEHILRGFSSIN